MGTIGVLPEEKERAQPFEVDVDVFTDVSAAGATDDLTNTIHYGEVAAAIAAVVENERHELLERVATRISEEVLAFDGADAVTVVIRKLRPPVPHDLATSAVRIHRTRS
jgi:7,8-dihydroneopterin aldolase/epimerase/oxygenase